MNQTIIDRIIKTGLQEDLTWGDITTEELIDDQAASELVLLQKQEGVVAGLEVAQRVFQLIDSTVTWQSLVKDGEFLQENTRLAKVNGKSRSLLMAERVALNLMQRMSGISTLTRQFVLKATQSSEKVKLFGSDYKVLKIKTGAAYPAAISAHALPWAEITLYGNIQKRIIDRVSIKNIRSGKEFSAYGYNWHRVDKLNKRLPTKIDVFDAANWNIDAKRAMQIHYLGFETQENIALTQ